MSKLANYNVKHTIDHFKGLCPECGNRLKPKLIKKRKNAYSRNIKSLVCEGCGYAEYVTTETEQFILDGGMDEVND